MPPPAARDTSLQTGVCIPLLKLNLPFNYFLPRPSRLHPPSYFVVIVKILRPPSTTATVGPPFNRPLCFCFTNREALKRLSEREGRRGAKEEECRVARSLLRESVRLRRFEEASRRSAARERRGNEAMERARGEGLTEEEARRRAFEASANGEEVEEEGDRGEETGDCHYFRDRK